MAAPDEFIAAAEYIVAEEILSMLAYEELLLPDGYRNHPMNRLLLYSRAGHSPVVDPFTV